MREATAIMTTTATDYDEYDNESMIMDWDMVLIAPVILKWVGLREERLELPSIIVSKAS